jgi:hypothetical protein
MYVKFVVNPERNSKETVHEYLYECEKYSFHYDPGNWEEGTFFFDESTIKYHTITLHKTDVYVMSDAGKTIDSFSWHKDEENKRCVRK